MTFGFELGRRVPRSLSALIPLIFSVNCAFCQDVAGTEVSAQATTRQEEAPTTPPDKRVFGVFPNYRTADGNQPFVPITARQKFAIGLKDSFDWPVYPVAGAFAALYQLEDQNPSFGQGMKGYGKRYITSLGDQITGNLMTESLMPSLLHEDPRYFRRGSGSTGSRIGYAVTRILVTRTDSGGRTFNFAEVGGNAIATAISNAYYPDTRTVSDNVEKLGIQLATDAFSQVMKEFWPDVKRRLFHKREEPLLSQTQTVAR
ncbi:MAG: hypothetical protein U0Q18_08795 [Bryobacteraceae bacterium]